MQIDFEKYHGCGNDFIIISSSQMVKIKDKTKFCQNICDRHYGIGADGLIFPTIKGTKVTMNYYNSDGSIANMCGNGMRCFIAWLIKNKYVRNKGKIFTHEGAIEYVYENDDLIEINMGKGEEIKNLEIQNHSLYFTKMHVPHLQVFVNKLPMNWKQIGSSLEKHPQFENGTNVNFVQTLNENHLQVNTWERGCGATLACGSGVCASCLTYVQKNPHLINNEILVNVGGGQLKIIVNDKNEVIMQGPATYIAKGIFKGV